jgi:hypothetical protein
MYVRIVCMYVRKDGRKDVCYVCMYGLTDERMD